MDTLEAIILGVVQGLTEYLPISSSGHLILGEAILGIKEGDSLSFAIIVHAATSLSSLIIFRKDIWQILKDLLKFEWNQSTRYAAMLVVSSIPVVIVGLLFEDQLESLFGGSVFFVGCMLILTGVLLVLTHFAKAQTRTEITLKDAIIIGIAQAIAVLPGISRSGSTIGTGLLIGIDKAHVAKFSFLMVIIPIMGKAALDTKDLLFGEEAAGAAQSEFMPLLLGFIAAFVVGLAACELMLRLVRKGKIYYFGFYCFVVGTIAIIAGLV